MVRGFVLYGSVSRYARIVSPSSDSLLTRSCCASMDSRTRRICGTPCGCTANSNLSSSGRCPGFSTTPS